MAKRLSALLRAVSKPRLEAQDLRAAFLRVAKEWWGDLIPLEVGRVSFGLLTVRCPDPLWRTEVLYRAEDLRVAIERQLPGLRLRRVAAMLA